MESLDSILWNLSPNLLQVDDIGESKEFEMIHLEQEIPEKQQVCK